MINLKINNRSFIVQKGISIIEACKFVGIAIPRFCYHIRLSVAGNCRMCLVETDKALKPIAACATPVMPGMTINTSSPFVLKARENVMETLLLNHPLDCPICDQAGECDLQDQSKIFGSNFSRFYFQKRVVEDKIFGSLIHTIMTRCIQCTRCVRFVSEFVGSQALGCLGRGSKMEIGSYTNTSFNSLILGNVIDLCPVGALTARSYTFKYRPWEWWSVESIDLMDSTGSNIYLNFNAFKEVRVLPKKNQYLNDSWISDLIRFSYDSISHSRIENCFFLVGQNSSVYFKSLSWKSVYKNLSYTLKNSMWKSFYFVINSTLNLETLSLLKILEYRGQSRIKIRLLTNDFIEPVYRWGKAKTLQLNNIKPLEFCFVCGSNLAAENILLNLKVKLLFNRTKFSVIGSGFNFKSNFSTLFVNLSLTFFLKLLQGRSSLFSKLFIKSKNSLILVGNTVKNSFSGLSNVLTYFEQMFPTVSVYNSFISNNLEGVNLVPFKKLTRKCLSTKNFYFLINLNDTIYARKYFSNLSFACVHSMGTFLDKFAGLILPVLAVNEEGGVFINFEQRPQIAARIDLPLKNIKPLVFFLKRFLALYLRDIPHLDVNLLNSELITANNVQNHYQFLNEVLNNQNLFNGSLENSINCSKAFLTMLSISLYPLKAVVEDPYRSNKVLRNSRTMLNCSRDLRIAEFNFNM